MRKIKIPKNYGIAEIVRMIKRLQEAHPDREVFFDGEAMEVVVR